MKNATSQTALQGLPDGRGYFGTFGGRFVPEILMPALQELSRAYGEIKEDPHFQEELRRCLRDYVGRPSPLFRAARLGEHLGLPRLYLKREDLNHTGAHKINNALGQALLARRMGKTRVVAETGAGMHGVAAATASALLGLECRVYMGTEDVRRQEANVRRMEVLGAEVIPVPAGEGTLKEAVNEALRFWITALEDTHYIIGSVVGPHPFPALVRDFQRVIGDELREQALQQEGRLPHILLACVGGGSNAMGFFYPFLEEEGVRLIGVEAGGRGLDSREHAATLQKGRPGVLHGALSYLLQDEHGQVSPVHSISAGLDYPGVGPEHSFLKETGRASYVAVTDREALDAFYLLGRKEGIIPALESAHALAYLPRLADELQARGEVERFIAVNLSGRGDKDMGREL